MVKEEVEGGARRGSRRERRKTEEGREMMAEEGKG